MENSVSCFLIRGNAAFPASKKTSQQVPIERLHERQRPDGFQVSSQIALYSVHYLIYVRY